MLAEFVIELPGQIKSGTNWIRRKEIVAHYYHIQFYYSIRNSFANLYICQNSLFHQQYSSSRQVFFLLQNAFCYFFLSLLSSSLFSVVFNILLLYCQLIIENNGFLVAYNEVETEICRLRQVLW